MSGPESLRTARLLLRPFVAADAPAVQRLASAREVAATTATLPHPYPDGAAAQWIASHAASFASGSSLDWAITTAADGVVGAIALRPSAAHLNGELGYWIGVPFWRRGYASEAAAAVVRHAFRALGLKRVHAHHMSSNPASGAVLRNAGLRWEGRLRAHLRRDGRFHDVELWGALDQEHDRVQPQAGAAPVAPHAGATLFQSCTPVLPVRDLEAALAFYEMRLGWKRVFASPAQAYAGLERNGALLHLSCRADAGPPQPVSCRFRVIGIDALHAECQAAGVLAPGEEGIVAQKPWGSREFAAHDRDGNVLWFAETSPPLE